MIGDTIVTVRGKVAEVFGNRFIVADNTGRVLVDAGRRGDDRSLVQLNQVVTVQGEYEDGALRPSFLVQPDNTVIAFRAHGGRHGGKRGHGGHRERGSERAGLPAPPAPPVVPGTAEATTR
ncbi:hypothetical protein [Sphingomonas aquatilis]